METYNNTLTEKGLTELKNSNPERYFKEVLCTEDFEGLKKLNTESNEIIDWKTLVQDGVCEIELDKLIGINWPENLDLSLTNISTLGKLKRTKGLYLWGVETLKDLGELEEVDGYLDLKGTSIEVQLEALEKIERGTLNVTGDKLFGGYIKGIEQLLEKEEVDGNLYLIGTSISTLGKLKRTRVLNLWGVETLKDLGELEEVDGNLDLKGTSISTLGKLKRTRGLDLIDVKTLTDLGELEEVDGNLDLKGTSISTLGKLKRTENLNLIDVKTLNDLGELEEVDGDLILDGTSIEVQLEALEKIRSGKLRINGNKSFGGDIKGIEQLLEKEEVDLHLDLRGTSISTLGKLKRTRGLDLRDVKTLTDLGGLEEVDGYLDLRGTIIEVQLEALKNIERSKLNVTGNKSFGGDIKGIEQLLEKEEVDLHLDLRGTSISTLGKLKRTRGLDLRDVKTLTDLGGLEEVDGYLDLRLASIEVQLGALEKFKSGKLKVTGDIYTDDNVRNIFDKCYLENKDGEYNLDYEEFDKTFGKDIGEIEDEENKKIAIWIIRNEYKKLYRETNNKVKEEVGEVTGDSLTEEQKNKIIELNNEFKEIKNRLDVYGVEYEND